MSWSRVLVYILGIALFSAAARAQERIEVPSNPIPGVPNARPAPTALSGALYRPAGASGRVPVVIVLHTCNGISGNLEQGWSKRLNDWGYAAFVLDSFRARDVQSVCSADSAGKVTPLDRAGDAINAAHVLAQLPGLDGQRIGALGMSHGGATGVAITYRGFEAGGPNPIKVVVDLYGACRNPQAHGTVPLLALAGESDNWGYPAKTCTEFQKALRPNQPMEVHTYPGVYHGFDDTRFMPARSFEGHTLSYDVQASKDAFERAHAFLDKYLR